MSQSDPEVHVYIQNQKGQPHTLIGKTEQVMNNNNPDFTRTFTIDYFFEKQQTLKFDVYDADDFPKRLEHIGSIETTLSKIMTAQKQTWTSDIFLPNGGKSRGKIVVRADPVAHSNNEIFMNVSA